MAQSTSALKRRRIEQSDNSCRNELADGTDSCTASNDGSGFAKIGKAAMQVV